MDDSEGTGGYADLQQLVLAMPAGSAEWQKPTELLLNLWLDDYWLFSPNPEVVETRAQRFSYLFDVNAARLIAAWGVSTGRSDEERDTGRQRDHPMSAGALYHRGHAIPHRFGGGMDINIVPQLGSVNIGSFRPLENKAVATPGSLYFTHWTYRGAIGRGQTPTGVNQGLLVAGQPPLIRHHGN